MKGMATATTKTTNTKTKNESRIVIFIKINSSLPIASRVCLSLALSFTLRMHYYSIILKFFSATESRSIINVHICTTSSPKRGRMPLHTNRYVTPVARSHKILMKWNGGKRASDNELHKECRVKRPKKKKRKKRKARKGIQRKRKKTTTKKKQTTRKQNEVNWNQKKISSSALSVAKTIKCTQRKNETKKKMKNANVDNRRV